MAEYHLCPKYGQKDCCSQHIEAFRRHVEGFSVDLTFITGETINVHPWIISEVIDNGNSWVVNRQNSPEYEDIDTKRLTQKSRILYARHHHWGSMTYYKNRTCPLK